MSSLSLRLPDDLDQKLAHEAAVTGLTRSEVIRQALAEHIRRQERARFITEYVQEAARGYADPALRQDAIDIAEEAVASGNEALEHAESARPDSDDGVWWR
jgi:predicted transcriptional regulator